MERCAWRGIAGGVSPVGPPPRDLARIGSIFMIAQALAGIKGFLIGSLQFATCEAGGTRGPAPLTPMCPRAMLRRDEAREVAPTMIIPTPRLVLREFTVEDWPAVLAYQSSPQYLRYYPAVRRTPRDARTFVALCIAWQRASPRSKYQLAITLRDDGRLIGNVGIRKPSPEATVAECSWPPRGGPGLPPRRRRPCCASPLSTGPPPRARTASPRMWPQRACSRGSACGSRRLRATSGSRGAGGIRCYGILDRSGALPEGTRLREGALVRLMGRQSARIPVPRPSVVQRALPRTGGRRRG